MLQGEHSAILSTFIKLLFVIKPFVLFSFEWQFYTGFTVVDSPTKIIDFGGELVWFKHIYFSDSN